MEAEVARESSGQEVICVSSWTAYIRPTLIWGFTAVMGFGLGGFGNVIGLFAIVRLTYMIFYIRSIKLFRDDRGVWCAQGILPWAKGVAGVKWRDIDQAHYYPNFFSYIFRSYTIRIGHRYTKSSEVVLRHMRGGNMAVQGINREHEGMAAAGVLN